MGIVLILIPWRPIRISRKKGRSLWGGKDQRGKGVSENKHIEGVWGEGINGIFLKLEGRLIGEKLGGAENQQMFIRGTVLFIPKGRVRRMTCLYAVQRFMVY